MTIEEMQKELLIAISHIQSQVDECLDEGHNSTDTLQFLSWGDIPRLKRLVEGKITLEQFLT